MDFSKDIDFDKMTPQEQKEFWQSIKQTLIEHGFEVEECAESDPPCDGFVCETSSGELKITFDELEEFIFGNMGDEK